MNAGTKYNLSSKAARVRDCCDCSDTNFFALLINLENNLTFLKLRKVCLSQAFESVI